MTSPDDVQGRPDPADDSPTTPIGATGDGPGTDHQPAAEPAVPVTNAEQPAAEPPAGSPTAPFQAAADALAQGAIEAAASPVHQARFAPLTEGPEKGKGTNLDLLLDVSVTVTAEMGSRSLPLEQVLELKPGSVVELDRAADEPIDLLVNGKPIARGEVVVIEDQFGVRITEILEADVGHVRNEPSPG